MNIAEQVIKDKKGNAVAIQIPIDKYKKIMEMLEELNDIKSFDKAMKRKLEFVPFKEAVQRIRTQHKTKK